MRKIAKVEEVEAEDITQFQGVEYSQSLLSQQLAPFDGKLLSKFT